MLIFRELADLETTDAVSHVADMYHERDIDLEL
jgi:hypothetical protein